jgi:peptidylprolyl isomerase
MSLFFPQNRLILVLGSVLLSVVGLADVAFAQGPTTKKLPTSPGIVPDSGESETNGEGDHSGHDHSHEAVPEQPATIKDDAEALKKAILDLPEEIRAEAQASWDLFEKTDAELATEMLKLRTIQLEYRNGIAQTPAATIAFREQRNATWKAMQKQFTNALDLIRYLPSLEAVSYLVTMVQHRFENDVYDDETFEAAARLLDMGQNFRFLFLAGARSAVVIGDFETAKKIYESLKDEDLEKVDLSLKYQLEKAEEQFKREQTIIERTDANTLPQVRIETTKGEFLIELFPDAAPSAVAHFLKLVEDGFYDRMDFSVVSQNLLALTGDASGDGRGNSGQFLVDEHGHEESRPGLRGSIVMAKIPLGEAKFIENSASSQFAILYLPILSIADTQSVIGRVIEGMDVVSRLRRVDPTKKKEKNEIQLPSDAILSTEIVRPGKELPEPVYVDVQAEIEKAVEAGMIKRKSETPEQ